MEGYFVTTVSQGTQTQLPWDFAVTKLPQVLKVVFSCATASRTCEQLLETVAQQRFDFWNIAISVLLEDLKTGTSVLQFELQHGTKVSERNN